MSYFKNINIEQNIATIGPTKTNLDGSQSYASDWTAITNQSAIQLAVFFNKNVLAYIDQSINSGGTEIVRTDTFPQYASLGLSRTVASVAPYYRVRLVNQSVAAATGEMVAAATAIFNPLPIGTDYNDNLKISSQIDSYNWASQNTPQGEIRTVSPFRLVGKQFEFFGSASSLPDSNFWTTYTLLGATGVISGSSLALTSGTNGAGSVSVYSNRKARYTQANALRYRANIRLGDTGILQNTRRWGAGLIANYQFTVSVGTAVVGNIYTNNSQQFTCLYVNGATIHCMGTGAPGAGTQTLTFVQGPGSGNLTTTANATEAYVTDGCYFQLVGTTFSVVTAKAGSPTAIDSGTFNGFYGGSYTPVTTNVIFEIYWTNGKVYFVINDQILHTVTASSGTWANTISLHCFMDNVNSGNSTSVVINSRSMSIVRLGPEDTASKWYYQHGATAGTGVLLKSGAGRLKKVAINAWVDGSTISLYDSVTTTNPIALIVPTTTGNAHTQQSFTIDYNLDFYNGLYLATANAATDVTIVYE